MDRRLARVLLGLILLTGGFVRLYGIDWDDGQHLHPDERFISMVEERLTRPAGLAAYFDSLRSPLNPYNHDNGSFVYGTLPLFLTKAVAGALGKTGYGGAYRVGRVLSSLFDLLTVLLVYRITRRFARREAALVAAGLFAMAPLSIQNSHFWTVETFLAAFCALALLGSVRHAQGRSGVWGDIGTGAALGLAVSCKVTALALAGALAVAFAVRAMEGPEPLLVRLRRSALRLIASLGACALVIRIALPYAFLGPSPLSFRLDPRYVTDLKNLANLSRSVAGFPPALQWAGRTVLFPLENFVLWGAGPFFGLAALAGLVWAAAQIRNRRLRALAPLVCYSLFVAAYHSLSLVKSIRYFYPIYPPLAVLAALALFELARRRGAGAIAPIIRRAPVLALLGTTLCGAAFSSTAFRPHTRIAASRWIYEHIPAPARIANEAWDDGLPLPLPDHDSGPYAGPVLPMFDPDSPAKVNDIVKALSGADWIAVTSGRVYSNVTRVPDVFPMSIAYYRALFSGRLGFTPVANFTSYPSLGPLRFNDDSSEEQFTVYDHPRVLLFQKTREFSAERVRELLLAAMPVTPPTMNEWETWPRSRRRVSSPVRPEDIRDLRRRSEDTTLQETRIGSPLAAIVWFAAILGMGILGAPIVSRVFPRLSDRGLGFARIFGLALATYTLTALVEGRVLTNGPRAAWASVLLVACLSGVCLRGRVRNLLRFVSENRRGLLIGEAMFVLGFGLFLGLRALNPEISWGEKPMDFSILNTLVRTHTLPPSDPWFAGAPLGYYTFGHEMIALLTRLTGLPTRLTFNLAFGLLGGTLLQGAFALLRSWGGTLRAGIAGAAFVGIAGNLSGLRQWWTVSRPRNLPLDWHYFWATSRVIKDTINEYPFWSLTFADLHAHVFAMPVFLLVAASALQLVRAHASEDATPRERLGSAAILGIAIALEALTNAWDIPFLAALLLLVAVVCATTAPFGRSALALLVAATTAFGAVRPFWVQGGGPPGFGWNGEKGASGIDVFTVFGLFLFLMLGWVLSRLLGSGAEGRSRRGILTLVAVIGFGVTLLFSVELACLLSISLLVWIVLRSDSSIEERLAAVFLVAGLGLVLFTQRLFIVDRMNTFFKLYLEAWLVFAVGTAAVLFSSPGTRGSISTWSAPARAAAALLLMASLFTTVTAGHGAMTSTRPTLPETPTGPTLDGLRYLEADRPGEALAVRWLWRAVEGTPVILEAQGPSYQSFGRISMLTGLPTVLGWDYHVSQRGNPQAEIEARKRDVRTIYSSGKLATVERLLRRYHVAYVYVGWLERKTYPAVGLRLFDEALELFEPAYENRDSKVYRVKGGEADDVFTPTREALPIKPKGEPVKTGPPVDEPEKPPSILATASDASSYAGVREPRDACVDERGRLWVADFGNSRIRIYDADGGSLGGWGGRGNGTFGLREPSGVASRGNSLYIADTWNGRILAFTLDGVFKAAVPGLYGPRGVAVGPDGRVWVTDTGNSRVIRYDAGLEQLAIIGKPGKGPGEFSSPVGIAAGPSGNVYVADTGNHRIQVLDSSGRFVKSLSFPGWNGSVEAHLEVDLDETLFVTDATVNQVVVMDSSGQLIRRLEKDEAGVPFAGPMGIALDRKTRSLYVVNTRNDTISKTALKDAKYR